MSGGPAPSFRERRAAGISFWEAGVGDPLVWLGECSPAHTLLAERFRVLVFDEPPERSLAALGIEQFKVGGTAHAAADALRLALAAPECIDALVLEAPTVLLTGGAQLESRLANIEMPTLVVFGTQDPEVPPDHCARYTSQIPICYGVLMYKAGAHPAVERPDTFAALVADFLERKEAFVVSNKQEKLVL